MLSIQFHSLGRQGQMGASPSILLPPALEPLPLDEALETVRTEATSARQRDATWTVLRGTPHPPFGARVADGDEVSQRRVTQRASKYALRYPAALRYFCETKEIAFRLELFDERRDRYRGEARLFAAALIAFALDEEPAFHELRSALERRAEKVDGGRFAKALEQTGALGEETVVGFLDFLGTMDPGPRRSDTKSQRERCRESLTRLESEVGISLETYIGEFADTVAFMETWQEKPGRDRPQPVTVYPAFTVAAQDPRTLTTLVTATSLVAAEDFRQLTCAIDPRNWSRLSTTFRDVKYVDEKNLAAAIGEPHGPALLREDVRIHAHEGGTDMGYFDNLLWVKLTVNHDPDEDSLKGWADLNFSLHSSIRSRFLWDERPGGLLVDGGWTKLRSISKGLWRVTARKVLRFADRTPQSSWDGPLDFGQTLNYLAPSTLSTWLESDIYGGEDPAVHEPPRNGEANA